MADDKDMKDKLKGADNELLKRVADSSSKPDAQKAAKDELNRRGK